MTTLPLHGASEGALRVVRGDRTSMIGGLCFAVVVVVMAAYVPFHFSLGTLTNLVGLFSLVILGTTWNLLAGYGGLVSIGQQAFIGAGGYAVIKLTDAAGIPLVLSVLLAGVVCAVLAYPTSYLLFRLVGGYLAIGTWVVAEVFKLVTTQIDALGGGSGLSLMVFREDGTSRIARIGTVYWLALTIAVAVVLATYLLMRSRLGLGLTAIRDNPTAAGSLGVAVQRSRRIVYVAASAGAGLAGALIATSSLRVTPDSIYSVNYTAYMIFIVVIGGIGTIEGPILGAIVFYVLQQELASHGTWYLVVLGAVAIAVVLTAPKGLWGLISRDGRLEVFPVGHKVRPPG